MSDKRVCRICGKELSDDIENDVWENVTEEEFNERKATFEDYLRFDYTPLSAVA